MTAKQLCWDETVFRGFSHSNYDKALTDFLLSWQLIQAPSWASTYSLSGCPVINTISARQSTRTRLRRSIVTSTAWATYGDDELVFGRALTPQEGVVHGLVVVYISQCSSCMEQYTFCNKRCFVTYTFSNVSWNIVVMCTDTFCNETLKTCYIL